jgi:branched-chain amino acid transport system permease protein
VRDITFRQCVLLIGCIVLVLLAPLCLKIVHIRILNEVIYFSLFAVSFNLLFGYAGLLSCGHAAYFGIGAYTTAILLKRIVGMPLLLAILTSGITASIAGVVIGFFCIRRKAGYFVLLTMAFNQLIWALAWKWRSMTGGDDGIGGFVPKSLKLGIVTLNLSNGSTVYCLSAVIVIFLFFLIWYLLKTPFGNTIRAIKVNEDRPAFLGYNVNFSKLLLFTMAAFFAGIAGSLYALFQDFVATSSVDLAMATQVIMMAILGGTGSFFGPVLGAAIFVYFTDWISHLTDRWEFILGALFIVLVLYFHRGAIGLIPRKLKSIFVSGKN